MGAFRAPLKNVSPGGLVTKKCAAGGGTMQNSAEGRCTIPARSPPPPLPGDSIDWCIILGRNGGAIYI